VHAAAAIVVAVLCRKAMLAGCWLPDAGRNIPCKLLTIWPTAPLPAPGEAGQVAERGPRSSQMSPTADCQRSLQGRQGVHSLPPWEHNMIPLLTSPLNSHFLCLCCLRNGQVCLLSLRMFI